MSIKAFLKSKIFFKQLAIAFVITILLFYITLLILRIYTDHGKSLSVPDLTGMTVEQAEKIINAKELSYQVIDSSFVKNAKPGTVIGQVPVAETQVKKNRTLFLTLCSMAPEQVAMPKLTDIAYRQALNVIESSGLEAGEIKYKPSEYTNLVLEQRVYGEPAEEGMLIPKGTKVDLVIGQTFSGEQTEIPDLLGNTYQDAREILGTAILNFGAVIFDDSFTSAGDSANARVWKQRPEPSINQKIYQGQSIDVWLTVDEEKLQEILSDKK
jgi:beta-lactam-binding protein with PASTA domain